MLTDSLAADGQTTMTGGIKAYVGSASAPSYTFGTSPTDGFFLSGTHQIGLAINGALVGFFNANGYNTLAGQPTGTPIGAVQDFVGSVAPSGWYLLYGQTLGRTPYASLFSVMGTTYGAGDGVTSFNLPDCRGRATFGQDNMGGTAAGRISVGGANFDGTVLGNSGGSQDQALSTANLAAHTHSPSSSVTDPGHNHAITDPGHTHIYDTNTVNTGSGTVSPALANATNGNLTTGNSATGISINSHTTGVTVTTTDATVGTGTGFTILSPAIIFTKIVFAGA